MALLTDPHLQTESGEPDPVQRIWNYYRTCELYQTIPEVHPEYRRTGKGPRATRRYPGA
ncbi:MAG: hypothetical protein WD342_01865 [Verrucomicrobiales bacterium]